MPSNRRNDPATIWKAGDLDIYGQPTWSDPIHVMVRWEEGDRGYITTMGVEERGRNTIFFEGDGTLEIGDYIARGHLTEVSPVKGSWAIKQTRRIPNLTGTKIEWRAIA